MGLVSSLTFAPPLSWGLRFCQELFSEILDFTDPLVDNLLPLDGYLFF